MDVSKLRDIPVSSHATIADVAKHLGVSKGKIQRMKKQGVIKHVSNTIKPYLTEKNKKDRLRWCLSMIDPRSAPHDPMFKGLFDYVFIDEKWYYITRKTLRYYKGADEVKHMQKEWDALDSFVDKERFQHVKQLLNIQYDEAVWWRNACLLYFQTFSKMAIPAAYEQPGKRLEYYEDLRFPFAPGN